MNGRQHYDEAERLLNLGMPEAEARAQVHALLALTAAQAGHWNYEPEEQDVPF